MIAWIKKLFVGAAKCVTHPIKMAVRNMDFHAGLWIPMRTHGTVFKVRKHVHHGDTYLEYQCPTCGTQLTDGPCGGAAINVVCDKCRINYGCLPGYDFPLNLGIFDHDEAA